MSNETISGVTIDRSVLMSLNELARCCSVPIDYIQELVDEGILEPVEINAEHWSFRGNCLQRVQVSVRLQQDLEVNLPGIAVILDLLDER